MDVSHQPKYTQAGTLAMNKGRPLAQTGTGAEHAKAILERYTDGMSLSVQADEIGVTRMRLNRLLLTYAEDDWRHAQIAKAITTLEDAETELGDATLTPDNVSVSRAREKARLAQWKLERLLARLFAQKQEVMHTTVPTFTINIGAQNGSNSGPPLDAEVVDNKG